MLHDFVTRQTPPVVEEEFQSQILRISVNTCKTPLYRLCYARLPVRVKR